MLLRGECGTTPNSTRSDMYCALRGSTVPVHPTVILSCSLFLPHSKIQLSVFFNLLFVFHLSSFMATRRVINRSYTAVYSVHLTGPYSNSRLCVSSVTSSILSRFGLYHAASFLNFCSPQHCLFIRNLFNDAVE
jgi:hypothetical protein